MKKQNIKLSRVDKILLTMYRLSQRRKKNLRFEDIVVALFKNYKEDFHLRGYPQYPDSENVEKAIYSNLKKNGLVNYGNKIFSLTDRGLTIVENLEKDISKVKIIPSIRFSRYVEKEISRIELLESFKLFLQGKESDIVDTDFYNYLGITVRTEKKDFLGRLETVSETMKELKSFKKRKPLHEKVLDFHGFMLNKFKSIVDYKTK